MIEGPTPNQIVQRLADLSRDLDSAQRELARVDEAAVRARARHELAFARALIASEGRNAEHRKAEATIATEQSYLDSEIAQQQVRAVRGRIDSIRNGIDVGRTLSSTLRAEMALAGVGT